MKLKTLKMNDKIRLTINGTSQALTVKQALTQFLDGGKVESFIVMFDDMRSKEKEKSASLGTYHHEQMMQIDLY